MLLRLYLTVVCKQVLMIITAKAPRSYTIVFDSSPTGLNCVQNSFSKLEIESIGLWSRPVCPLTKQRSLAPNQTLGFLVRMLLAKFKWRKEPFHFQNFKFCQFHLGTVSKILHIIFIFDFKISTTFKYE